MLSRPLKPSLLLLIFSLTFLGGHQLARACSCGPNQTVLDEYDWADVVVIARAVSIEKVTPAETAPTNQISDGMNYVDGVKSTTMSVEQVFKGTLKVGDKMVFAQGGGADCIWTFSEESVGNKYLFYLKRFENAPVWLAGTCGRSTGLDYAHDDLRYLNNLDKTRGKTRISGTFSFAKETDESVAGRKIRIVGAKTSYDVKTDEHGTYEIYNVPPGKYTVEPEIPRGWKVDAFSLRYSPSVASGDETGTLKKIPIVVEDKKHAGLDISLDIDNAIRGHIYDALGRGMNGVCLDLIPANGSKGQFLMDCTEKDGAFEIDEIPPGSYVLVINEDGQVTSTEPFGTFYYPNVPKREGATVFHIRAGDFVENLEIYPPVTAETVTVEGVFRYSDGKPVVGESVSFKAAKAGQEANDADDRYKVDARVETDSKGRFSMKVLKGARGWLFGSMYTYEGEFENCPKLERLIKETGQSFTEIKTDAVEIVAETNLYGIGLKFSYPGCKKKKID